MKALKATLIVMAGVAAYLGLLYLCSVYPNGVEAAICIIIVLIMAAIVLGGIVEIWKKLYDSFE